MSLPSTHSDHRPVSPYWRVFTRTTSPVWVAILLGVTGSAAAPFFFAKYFGMPITDPATGLVFGVPVGHLLVAVLTPAGALATLVFKLGERSARERELEQKDEENRSIQMGVDQGENARLLERYQDWSIRTMEPVHSSVAWKAIVVLSRASIEVRQQAVNLALERLAYLMRTFCPFGCEQKIDHVHAIDEQLMLATTEALCELASMPGVPEALRLRLPDTASPCRVPRRMRFQLSGDQRLDLSGLTIGEGLSMELTVTGAKGSRVLLPEIGERGSLSLLVGGSIRISRSTLLGTLSISPASARKGGRVMADIKGVGVTGEINFSGAPSRSKWRISLGEIRGLGVIAVKDLDVEELKIKAKVNVEEGGRLFFGGSIGGLSKVFMSLTDSGDQYEGAAGVFVDSLTVKNGGLVYVSHVTSRPEIRYSSLSIQDDSRFFVGVGFPGHCESGRIAIAGLEMAGGDQSFAELGIAIVSGGNLGMDSVEFSDVACRRGAFAVFGPRASTTGRTIPGRVALHGKGEGTLRVQSTASGPAEAGGRVPQAMTEVLLGGELDLTIEAGSSEVELQRTPG